MSDDDRLALEQEIADLRFAWRQATDRASLAEVKCSQLFAELEKARRYRDLAEADLSIAMLAATRNGSPSACETVRLRLTEAEREAVEAAARIVDAYEDEMDGFASGAAATLRGLLSRHFPVPENPPSQDDAPDTRSNQSAVSLRPECAISPPWMARPFYVDPAEGWAYGFPRLYDPAKDGDMTEWMVANGYPQHLADQNLPCTFTAQTGSH